MSYQTYAERHQALIGYLKAKTEENDWHAVSDAANDLRVMEATYNAAALGAKAADAAFAAGSKPLPIRESFPVCARCYSREHHVSDCPL
jgi:phosphoserine phosphatase